MNPSTRHPGALLSILLTTLLALSATTAVTARADQQGGWELMLAGDLHLRQGEPLHVTGVAYQVDGLDTLRPHSGEIEVSIERRASNNRSWTRIERGTVRSDRAGRFSLDIAANSDRQGRYRLVVLVGGRVGRRFEFGLSQQATQRLQVITDRRLYEPGETVHVFLRGSWSADGRPTAGATVQATVRDSQNREIFERELRLGQSGATSFDIPLADSVDGGTHRITLSMGRASANAQFQVGDRTVERLSVDVELDQPMVRPGGILTGRVTARSPSGTPVVGAEVHVTSGDGGAEATVRTDNAGVAAFRLAAPRYLAGDNARQRVVAQVRSEAHGALSAAASYMLARSPYQVSLSTEAGAIVPEVPTRVFVRVTNPLGGALPDGVAVRAEGPAVRGGEMTGTTDGDGLLEVPVLLAVDDVSPVQSENSGCPSGTATLITLHLGAERPRQTTVCAQVAPHARVLPRVTNPIVDVGGVLEVDVARRPSARTATVLLEVRGSGGQVVASSWLASNQSRARIQLPAQFAGLARVTARPVSADSALEAIDTEGAVGIESGASSRFLVRHADSFSMELTMDQAEYRVGQQAELRVAATGATPTGWITLVARDLMAHGGEADYEIEALVEKFRRAAADPAGHGSSLLVRAALAAMGGADGRTRRPEPIVRPPWWQSRGGRRTGLHRDPIQMREQLRRQRLGQVMVDLEQRVSRMPASGQGRTDLVETRQGRTRFRADVLAHLREHRGGAARRTLGDEQMTLAMVQGVDSSFSFDTVARRVARKRLAQLMNAVARFTDPDNSQASRASAGIPPEQWLSRLVQSGSLPAGALLDPWGRAFVMRRATGRPTVLLSDRAPDWELISPGPDGRPGTGDDVRDPFARVVPRGTLFATVSGEDNLMRQLSLLAPGATTLRNMWRAYTTVSQAVRDEQERQNSSAVRARRSEMAPMAEAAEEAEMDDMMAGDEMLSGALGGLGMSGSGRGGGGMGYGAARMASATTAAAPRPMMVQAASGSLQALGERIREDFPATLLFLGEVPLDGSQTTIPIPLADALSTYRVEAIAWTPTGFVQLGRVEFSVNQTATVDAPIPPFATEGDVLRIPVRVENRTNSPLEARVGMEASGIALTVGAPVSVQLGPQGAEVVVVEARAGAAGEGTVTVRAVSASGAPLDAVRRPLTIRADARLVQTRQQLLLESGAPMTFEVPADATERGAGELRIAAGTAIFGDWAQLESVQRVWAQRMIGDTIAEPDREAVRDTLQADYPNRRRLGGQPSNVAWAIGAGWGDSEIPDSVLARAIVRATVLTSGEDTDVGHLEARCTALVSLSLGQRLGGRPGAREALSELVQRLREQVGNTAAVLDDDAGPSLMLCAAAGLALTNGGPDARADEMLRRAARFTIDVGDTTFVEDPAQNGPRSRLTPTGLAALTHVASDRSQRALRYLRAQTELAAMMRREPNLTSMVAAGLIAGGSPREVTVRLDGRVVTTSTDRQLHIASLEGAGRPGDHRIEVTAAGTRPGLVLAHLDLRYGRPWTAAPPPGAPLDVSIAGVAGPRDRRAGLAIDVRNEAPRTVSVPVVEIDLPAGVELDQPTRDALAGRTVAVRQTGRVVAITLAAMPAGAYVRLPLPIRWSVGGALRGLGITAYDATMHSRGERPSVVLPSRVTEVADSGEAPPQLDPESEAPEHPDPPVRPFPRPIDTLRPLTAREAR